MLIKDAKQVDSRLTSLFFINNNNNCYVEMFCKVSLHERLIEVSPLTGWTIAIVSCVPEKYVELTLMN